MYVQLTHDIAERAKIKLVERSDRAKRLRGAIRFLP